MKYRIQIAAVLLALFLGASSAWALSWRPSDGWRGWNSYNVDSMVTQGGAAVISAGKDPRGFAVEIPVGRLDGPVRVRLRTMDVSTSLVCVLYSGDMEVAHQEEKVISGTTWRDYLFDFGGEAKKIGYYVDSINLVFRHAHSVQIGGIETGPSSFSDFFIVRGLRHPDVNFTPPYYMFGYPCTEVFYMLMAMGLAAAAVYAAVKRKGRGAMLAGMVFLALFVVYDLRNVYEEAAIIRATTKDFLSAPAGKKRFFWDDDMISFGSFVDRVVPRDAGAVRYFGDRDRFLYFRYLLYPIKLVQGEGPLTKYDVFYDNDNVSIGKDRLSVDGKTYTDDGEVFRFRPGAFVFKKR